MPVSAVWPVSEYQDWDGSWGALPGSTLTSGTVRALAWWDHSCITQVCWFSTHYLQSKKNFIIYTAHLSEWWRFYQVIRALFFIVTSHPLSLIVFFFYTHINSGHILPAALSWGGGCSVDDVCPNRRPPPSILFLLHSVGGPNRPESSSTTYCSVPASPWPPAPGARHRQE